MHADSAPDTRTLNQIVAEVARRSSDGLLVTLALVGVVGVASIALILRQVWWLTPLLLGIAAFGTWGIADRERNSLGRRGIVFRLLRGIAVLAGAAAAAFAAVMLFAIFVGGLIS